MDKSPEEEPTTLTFREEFEKFSTDSKFFCQTSFCLANFYYHEKNYSASRKYLKECENLIENGNTFSEALKNEVKKLKANILHKKLENNLNDAEKEELLSLTDEYKNSKMHTRDLEKLILMNFETKLNGRVDGDELKNLEAEISNKAIMHECNIEFIYLKAQVAFKMEKYEDSQKYFDEYLLKCDKLGRIKARNDKIKMFKLNKTTRIIENVDDKLMVEYERLRNDVKINEVHTIDFEISKLYFEKYNYKELLEFLEQKHGNNFCELFSDRKTVNEINYMLGISTINVRLNDTKKINDTSQINEALNYFLKIKNSEFKHSDIVNYCIKSL